MPQRLVRRSPFGNEGKNSLRRGHDQARPYSLSRHIRHHEPDMSVTQPEDVVEVPRHPAGGKVTRGDPESVSGEVGQSADQRPGQDGDDQDAAHDSAPNVTSGHGGIVYGGGEDEWICRGAMGIAGGLWSV